MSEDENVEDTAESPMKPMQMDQDEREPPQTESSAKKRLDMSNATTAGPTDQEGDHQSTTSMREAPELPEHTPPPPQAYVAPRDRKKYKAAQALGRDLLLQKVAVAYDCLNAIQDINSGSEGITGPVIKEISDGKSDFQHILFTHEERLSNMEAHHLARYALHLGEGRHVWLLGSFDTTIIPVIRNSDQ
ncbi:hypothetical protein D1007_12895 [Hordeum vulgare]|nr:hypothetical protein D1007_12895 [Hordeum vulgare]